MRDSARFYITYPPGAAVVGHTGQHCEQWRPVQNASRCLSFSTLEDAEQALRWIVGNAWSSKAVWSYLGTFAKELYTDHVQEITGLQLATDMNREFMRGRVPRTPKSSCVCVAIAYYPDPDWEQTECFNPDLPPALLRDICVFVGTHGCGPDGPRFGDLTKQEDQNLVGGAVLRFAALSAIG